MQAITVIKSIIIPSQGLIGCEKFKPHFHVSCGHSVPHTGMGMHAFCSWVEIDFVVLRSQLDAVTFESESDDSLK